MADDRRWYAPEARIGVSTQPPAPLRPQPSPVNGANRDWLTTALTSTAAVLVIAALATGGYFVLRSADSASPNPGPRQPTVLATNTRTTAVVQSVPATTSVASSTVVPASVAPATTAAPSLA